MRIQHNIMAMNSYRNLATNNSGLSKNLEKLSSGYRINRAGDDAAGLAISEKMRAQISGLDQAQKNAQSGINLVKTAEGALTEVHDMLNRMVTLATQSANGTYGDTDRQKLQAEIDALTEEIDRIAENSNFNGTKLLDGTLGSGAAGDAAANVGATLDDTNVVKLTEDTAFAFAEDVTDEAKTAFNEALGEGVEISVKMTDVAGNAGKIEATDKITIEAELEGYTFKVVDETDAEVELNGSDLVVGTGAGKVAAGDLTVNIYDADDNKVGTLTIGMDATATANGTSKITLAAEAAEETEETEGAGGFTAKEGVDLAADCGIEEIDFGELTVEEDATVSVAYDKAGDKLSVTVGETKYEATPNKDVADLKGQTVELDDGKGNKIKVKIDANNAKIGKDAAGDLATIEIGTYAPASAEEGGASVKGLQLQIGADAKEIIGVEIDSMKADALKIKDLSIGDVKSANKAIDTINAAIETVSVQRGKLGAIQNRLEHTINNLGVMEENIQDAEANIRDTDIADEMMAYTKNNILIQSAQAMLAQANQVPQGVLQLMQ